MAMFKSFKPWFFSMTLTVVVLQKYGFSGTLLLEETEQGVLLRKKEAPHKDKKLSWEETYKEMAAERENWDDFDITSLDGIDGEEFDAQKI